MKTKLKQIQTNLLEILASRQINLSFTHKTPSKKDVQDVSLQGDRSLLLWLARAHCQERGGDAPGHLASFAPNALAPSSYFGIDKDGETVRLFDLKDELYNKYFVLIFLPTDLTFDSEEVLSFKASLESFEAEGCQVKIFVFFLIFSGFFLVPC